MTTYIITPFNKVVTVDPANMTCDLCNQDNSLFIIKCNDVQISPDFEVEDYYHSENTLDDAIDLAQMEAVEWMRDFLIRLHDQHKVIQCTTDGEMFLY